MASDPMQEASRNASSRLSSMGMPTEPGGPTDQGKQPLGAVRYRAAENPAQSCGNCSSFQAPNKCALVAGNIDPQATCDLWSPQGAQGQQQGPPMGGQMMTAGPPPGP